jgi:hypothetical protein
LPYCRAACRDISRFISYWIPAFTAAYRDITRAASTPHSLVTMPKTRLTPPRGATFVHLHASSPLFIDFLASIGWVPHAKRYISCLPF